MDFSMKPRSVSLILAVWLAGQPLALAAEVSLSPMAGAGRYRVSIESLHERRWKHVIRQGMDISCGSAALATILRYQFGQQVSERAIIQSILRNVKQEEVRKRGGFSLLDLKRVAGDLGYTVQGYKTSLEQLRKYGHPAIIPITVRNTKHFVVFRGMVGDRVVLADPAFGNIVLEENHFAKVWQGVTLVVDKKDKRIPSQLGVSPDELAVAESPEALSSFLGRDIHTAVDPDEF